MLDMKRGTEPVEVPVQNAGDLPVRFVSPFLLWKITLFVR